MCFSFFISKTTRIYYSLFFAYSNDQLTLWLNARGQIAHPYGFSPVWIRSCFLRVPPSAKAFQQNRQPYGLSPVWIRIWICCELRLPKVFPHSRHGKERPPSSLLCEWRWLTRARPSGNSSPHSSQATILLRCDTMCLQHNIFSTR